MITIDLRQFRATRCDIWPRNPVSTRKSNGHGCRRHFVLGFFHGLPVELRLLALMLPLPHKSAPPASERHCSEVSFAAVFSSRSQIFCVRYGCPVLNRSHLTCPKFCGAPRRSAARP